ncbi:Uma2 family endonuclease [Terriglobus sp.]|uniref:Uma2 family endonuclease n=1 Tax=Terriglobus sp. TaxID=1889013 RepID=UPI003AFFEDCB
MGSVKLPDGSVRAADVAWISRETWDTLSVDDRRGFASVPPDFVIELLSSSDNFDEAHRRLEMWVSNGAGLGWLIDASGRAVTIYRPGREGEHRQAVDHVEGEGPVAGLLLTLSNRFALP